MEKKIHFITTIVTRLRHGLMGNYPEPLVDQMIQEFPPLTENNDKPDPFIILISCLLSLRAKDVVTIHVCRELFLLVRTPEELLALPVEELEHIIYRTGYYKTKAQVLRHVCSVLLQKYNGSIPSTQEQLLAIKGIGLKTANLTLGIAYNQPAICIDTHVHRISNILGLIQTKNADHTEAQLRTVLPKKYWIEWNKLLVMLGQNICTGKRPLCGRCPLTDICPKIGVTPRS